MADSSDIQEVQEAIELASTFIPGVKEKVGSVIAGQEGLIDSLLVALLAGGHVLIEGVPGLAKTLSAKTLAETLGCGFSRVQFTPDLLPADLLGTTVYNPQDHVFTTNKGPVFANLLLADEINRAPPKVQSALLEAMQERQVTLGGETLKLPIPFFVMATQNPIEQEGTYPLPEAQVDRFMLKVHVDYPQREEEQVIIRRMAHPEVASKTEIAASPELIIEARRAMDRIYLAPRIEEYILDLVFATRPRQNRGGLSERQRQVDFSRLDYLLEYGASPRASLALSLAAKGRAFLASRAYVVPQDVKDAAVEVLRHRLVTTYEAEAENITVDDIVFSLLNELRTP